MEKAGGEFEGSASLKAELTCSICLCLYKEPVSLSCGHSFCKKCIQEVLQAQQQSQAPLTCPMCKLEVQPILELQKNVQLCNIVEAFQATAPKEKQDKDSEEQEVLACDHCLDESQPAVKTCLICDVSLCQAHLNKHNAKASRQNHILVEGAGGSVAEDRRCMKHGRLLECYCQNEGRYICMVCAIWGRHQGHKVITLEKGHAKQLGNLSYTLTQQQERKSALVTALEGLQKSENQLKTNTNTVTSQIQNLFDEIKTQLIKKENKILSEIQSNEKKLLAGITKLKKEMEKRREEIEQNIQSLEEMREEQDIFFFFNEFEKATHRIASQNSGIDRVNVTVVQMDGIRDDFWRVKIHDAMVELDLILMDVRDKFANQITWSGTKPN